MARTVAVYIESTPKRAFAVAVDWPGWARGGKTPDAALASLAEYAPRYAVVARRARIDFPEPVRDASAFEVVEWLRGNASTEFGVPGATPDVDRRALSTSDAERITALLKAAWATFDAAAKAAEGVALRTGPRGGGRDLEKMRDHVVGAERAYLASLGGERGKTAEALTIAEVRKGALEALAARVRGEDLSGGGRRKLWEPRYYARRSAWHSLDHAWEIQDRAESPAKA